MHEDPGLADGLRFAPLEAEHLHALARQPSQRMVLGMPSEMSDAEAESHAAQRIGWSAFDPGGRLIACMGIAEQFPGRQGVAWALLAAGIGRRHVALTRFIRDQLDHSGLRRIEALAPCADVEPGLELLAQSVPGIDPQQLLGAALALAVDRPTPEVRWAALLGLRPVHVLRKYGAASESYLLLERLG